MLLTHRFGSSEALDRAIYWLTWHGIEVSHSEVAGQDCSRLILNLPLSEVSAALALIDSIENADPEGWPPLFERPRGIHSHATPPAEVAVRRSSPHPIHWQSREPEPAIDHESRKAYEYGIARWG